MANKNLKRSLIIVVAYNGEKWMDECLSSVSPAHGIDGIVIDNGSSDATISIIKKKYPYVRLIQTDKNIGFGQANNIGLKYAMDNDYEYAYLLNQDAWISPSSLLKLVNIAEKYKQYGIVSPIHVYRNENITDRCFSECLPKDIIDDYFTTGRPSKEIYETHVNIPAAHWLLNLEAIKVVGGVSPTFFHFGEDDNLTHRMRYWGFKSGIVPGVFGVHDRETRSFSKNVLEKNKKTTQRLAAAHWRMYLSNVNSTKKEICKQLLLSIFLMGLKYPYWTFKSFTALLLEIKKIKKNREISREEGAFLNIKS